MYLLNRVNGSNSSGIVSGFTFHNVSIKSLGYNRINVSISPLHSTMYLLNPYARKGKALKESPLHSTMYLLNLERS